MSDPVLFLRADASPTQGTGHVMRMLALGQAWRDGGGDVVLGASAPSGLLERAARMGARVAALPRADAPDGAAATLAEVERCGAAAAALDGYTFSRDLQAALRAGGRPVLVVDDNAENGAYASDLLLNQNLHASADMYARREAWTSLLLGPTFTLLRREFWGGLRATKTAPVGRTRVLVSMGGADPVDATGELLAGLARMAASTRATLDVKLLTGAANPRLDALQAAASQLGGAATVFAPVDDITPFLSWADVAVAASGSTFWELCAFGVPTLLVPIADNQVELAAAIAARGAAVALPDARTQADGLAWLDAALALAHDEPKRAQTSHAAQALVDGEGARRVASALRRLIP